MKANEEKHKQRINRIIGQLRGIERMVGTKRECGEILQQISAIKKAIDGLSQEIVVDDMCQRLPKEEASKIKHIISRVISI